MMFSTGLPLTQLKTSVYTWDHIVQDESSRLLVRQCYGVEFLEDVTSFLRHEYSLA